MRPILATTSASTNWFDRFLRLSFFLGLVVLAFIGGFYACLFRVFPFDLLRNAAVAGQSLVEAEVPPRTEYATDLAVFDNLEIRWYREASTTANSGSNANSEPDASASSKVQGDEAILFVAGSVQFPNLNPWGALATLIDRNGKVLHRWANDPQLWSDLKNVSRVPGISGPISPVAVHLYPNGDLLSTYHGNNTFPFAIGMAKFDKNSKLLWKRENFCHHNFTVASDGTIFVPSLEVVESPIQIGNTSSSIYSNSGKIYRDQVLQLDSDGNELMRIDLVDALVGSGWGNLFFAGSSLSYASDDPLHLNDVQVVDAQFASQASWLKPGDLIISLRNLNCIAILDTETRLIKWISSGTMLGQHSPRMLGGSILALDNLGGSQETGCTQLSKINLDRGLAEIVFPKSNSVLPESMCTVNSGFIDLSSDGKRALVCLSLIGVIWEVDLESSQVRWEMIAGDPQITSNRMIVGCAKYVNVTPFWE